MAFCEPSGCGIAPLPMKSPSLMSASDAFTTATTSILSARLSVSASPLSDFALTVLPSTFSMTPRRRTVCGACASAAVAASAATRASAARIALVFMIASVSLHRRIDAAAAHRGARRFQRTVGQLLGGDDEDFRARLDVGRRARREHDDLDVIRHDEGLVAVLVFRHQLLAVRDRNFAVDIGIGHGAAGHQ